ncbi:hypothetical protein AHAS_Ahas13G0112400 [Arachis hypogaea]
MPVGEVTVTLEDVLHIFGLPIDGEIVTGWTDSSHDFLVSHFLSAGYHPLRGEVDGICPREALERMPWLAPIPRQQLSHHPGPDTWMSTSTASIKHAIDFMEEGHWCHSSVSNGFLRTEWFTNTDMHNPPSGSTSHTS